MSVYATFTDAAVITKSDTADNTYSAIYVGGTGHLTVVTERGSTVLISAIPAGTLIPLRVSKVLAATTATLLVGLKK
jgi:fucose permease